MDANVKISFLVSALLLSLNANAGKLANAPLVGWQNQNQMLGRNFQWMATTPGPSGKELKKVKLPPLESMGEGWGNDQVKSIKLNKHQLEHSLKTLNHLMKKAKPEVSEYKKIELRAEFTRLVGWMKKHEDATCKNKGIGMVCMTKGGSKATFPMLSEQLASRAIARRDGKIAAIGRERLAEQRKAEKEAAEKAKLANAGFNNYMNGNAQTMPVMTSGQVAFQNAPAVILPQALGSSGVQFVDASK